MRQFVLDASVTMAWCFEDESSRASEAALDLVGQGGALVPVIWPYEVANALLIAERRGRISLAKVGGTLQVLQGLPITVDPEGCSTAFRGVFAVARQARLAVYDAAYLELAIRRRLPLEFVRK